MSAALSDLPCVEPGSVKVKLGEARLKLKKGETCDDEQLKKTVADAGKARHQTFTVTNIKAPTTK